MKHCSSRWIVREMGKRVTTKIFLVCYQLSYSSYRHTFRVARRKFLHENRVIELKLHEISLFLRKSYFVEILKKILVFAYFVLSYCFVISLNFEKQFQEMMNRFKIKPIRWKLFLLKLIHTNILSKY